ncbi:hypothetical protein OH807_40815 [Kitasatospora sp. NBC_01560]|uniref:hypothetical protein n=1 Tax=Kitasatospora sp. NBC_01560 TaxID=2975965 RepID=UPI00386E0F8C
MTGQDRADDPAYREVVRAFVDGDPFDRTGGPLDVRAVVAGIRPEAKDGFLLEEVPWDRFPEGAGVAPVDDLATDETARLMAPLPWMRAVETARDTVSTAACAACWTPT